MLKKIAGAVVAVAPLSAFAALPIEVTTAISGAQADGTTLAWSLVALAVVVGVVMYLKRKAG